VLLKLIPHSFYHLLEEVNNEIHLNPTMLLKNIDNWGKITINFIEDQDSMIACTG